MSVKLIHGDCLEVIPRLPANSIDAVVTDPPYHLTSIVKRFGKEGSAPAKHGTDGAFARASKGFMGKEWDGGDIAFRPETWEEVYRVMKPGAHLAAFGGSRTVHRMTCAIEDAGFEIREVVMWVYGSGFPKSHDVSKGIDKMLGAEREVIGTQVYGDGHTQNSNVSIGFGGSDPDVDKRLVTAPGSSEAAQWEGWGTALKPAYEPIIIARKPLDGTVATNTLKHGVGGLNIDACRVELVEEVYSPDVTLGRWPANLMHDGSPEVLELFAEFGERAAGRFPKNSGGIGTASGIYGKGHGRDQQERTLDSGSAARFFYCAKANKTDRAGSSHPTVKPISLLRWVSRLITPPDGTILDPFAGSGTTGQAAMEEGFNAILIEREASYVKDIQNRFSKVA